MKRSYRRLRAAYHQAVSPVTWRIVDFIDREILNASRDRRMVADLATHENLTGVTEVKLIYVDVSVISNYDAGTGIQRVVRSLKDHLPVILPAHVRIKFLIYDNVGKRYTTLNGKPIQGGPETLFFGLDFATDTVFRSRLSLRSFKQSGGRLWFLLHDVLPLSHPHWFTPISRLRYRRWLRVCASLANGFICVSPQVADELRLILKSQFDIKPLPQIRTIQLGSNISDADRVVSENELPSSRGLTPALFRQSALIVGTLEPRKGHVDVLDAFEALWSEGFNMPLVLVGRPGWQTDRLKERIVKHDKFGEMLFWLTDVSDRGLSAAYRFCRLVIVPSLAEGFGLPLDEALAMGKPVLARNIPVFQRHGDGRVDYFAERADTQAIKSAILRVHQSASLYAQSIPLRRWEQTAEEILDALLGAQGTVS